ncbi:MAG TPA: HEAT repeat domain-containing protein [Polyangiales bacterium]
MRPSPGRLCRGARTVPRGAAGTEPTQQALLELMRDSKLSDEDRNAAGLALIRNKHPAVSSAHALEGMLDDARWAQYAVLGLGTFARLFGEARLVEERERIGKLLVARLAAVRSATDRSDVFSGLSNSGYAGMLPAVRPYLDDADETNRVAAVEAIRLVHDPEVERIAIRKLSDDAGAVRMAALLVAGNLEPTPPLVQAVSKSVLHDQNSDVRQQSLRLLVTWSEHAPELRATIKKVAESNSSEPIRGAAQLALRAPP